MQWVIFDQLVGEETQIPQGLHDVRFREPLTREPNEALLMVASGSQINIKISSRV